MLEDEWVPGWEEEGLQKGSKEGRNGRITEQETTVHCQLLWILAAKEKAWKGRPESLPQLLPLLLGLLSPNGETARGAEDSLTKWPPRRSFLCPAQVYRSCLEGKTATYPQA